MATNREREPRDLTFQKFVNAPEGLAPVQHQADTDTSQFVGGEFTVGKPAQQIGPTDAEAWANLGVQIAGLGEATTKVLHARANKQEREDQDETESKINAFILTESNPEKRKEFIQKAIDDTPAYIDNTSWKKTTLTKYQSSFLGDRSADEYAQDKILDFNTEWLKEGKRTDNQEYKLALEGKFGSDLTIANSPFFKGSLNQLNSIINNTKYFNAREAYINTVASLLTIPDKINLHNLDTGSQAFFKGQPEQLGMIQGIQALGEEASVAQQREVVWGIIREQGKGFEEQIQNDQDIRARITLEVNKGVNNIRLRLSQEVAALNLKSQQDSFNNAKGQGAVSADATMNLLVTGVSVSGREITEHNLAVFTFEQYSPEIINDNNHPAFRGKEISTLSVIDRQEAMDAWIIGDLSKVEEGQTKSRWEALGIFKDPKGNTNTTPAQYLEQIKNTPQYQDRQKAFFAGINNNQKATYEQEQTQMILVPAGVKSDDIYNRSTASLSLTLDLPKIAHADLSVGALRGKSFEDFVNSIEEPKEKELLIKRYPAGSIQGSWVREYWDKYQANIRGLDVTVAKRNAVNNQREDAVRMGSINSDADQNTVIRAFISKISTGPQATKIISYILASAPGTPGASYPTRDSVEKAYNQLYGLRIQLLKSGFAPFPELYKERIQLFNPDTEDTYSAFMDTLEPLPKTKGGGGGSGSGGSSKQNTTESFVEALGDAGTSYAHDINSSNMAAAFINNVLDPASTTVTPSTQRFKESLNNAYGELGAPPLNSEMNEEEKKTFLLSTRIRPNTPFFSIAGRHLDASEEYFTRTGGRATLNQAGADLYAVNKAYTAVTLSSAVASDLTEVYGGFSVFLNKLADNPDNIKKFLLDSGNEGKMIQFFATIAAFSKLDINRIPDGDKRREIEKMMPLIKDLAKFNPLAGAFNKENQLESTILDREVQMIKILVESDNPKGQISIPNFSEIHVDGEPARGLFGRVESSHMMNANNTPQVVMRILSDRTSTEASYAFLGADAHTKSPEELKERAQRADAVISSRVPYGIPEIDDTTSVYPITTEAGTTRLWKDLAQGEKLLVRAMAAVYGTLPGSEYINKHTTTEGDPRLFKTIRAMTLAATGDGDNKQTTLMAHQNAANKNLSNQNREIEPIIEYVEGSPVITYKLAERNYPPAIEEDLAKFSSSHKPTDGVREFIVTPTGRLIGFDSWGTQPPSSIWPGLGSENTPPPLEQAFATILPPTSKFSARLKTVLLDNSDASLNYLYDAFKIPKEGRNLDLTEKGSSALNKLSEALNRSPQWSGAAADNMIRSLAENRFTIDSNENSLFLVVDTIDGNGGPAEIRIDLSALGQVPYVRAMGVHYSNHEAAQLYHVLDRLEQYKKQSQRQRPPLTGSVGLSDTDLVLDNETPPQPPPIPVDRTVHDTGFVFDNEIP